MKTAIGIFLTSYVLTNVVMAAVLMLAPKVRASPAEVFADVAFHAVGSPGFVTIDGKGAAATGTINQAGGKVEGKFSCDLSKLETGIALRDRHMREKYLEVGKYPKAELVLDQTTVPATGGTFPWTGKLTLHGQTKPVSGTATASGANFSATFTVTLSDYGVDIPAYLGVTVAKDVTVTVTGAGK